MASAYRRAVRRSASDVRPDLNRIGGVRPREGWRTGPFWGMVAPPWTRTGETARRGTCAPRTTRDAAPQNHRGFALLAGVYGLAAFFSLRLALVEENITPLWPPTGIAVAVLLLFGTRWWPGIAIGALAVNLPITESPFAAVITAVGNTLAPLLTVWILRRARFRTELDRPRDVVVLLFAALSSMLLSATIGAASLVLSDQLASGEFWTRGPWWAGDSMGVLVVAPFLLVAWNRAHHRYLPPRRLELLELFVVLAVLAGSRCSP